MREALKQLLESTACQKRRVGQVRVETLAQRPEQRLAALLQTIVVHVQGDDQWWVQW
ncbi:hypothetical protein [Kineococcus sp. SYSU DK004]|uniref:hypothetical protein n=1 Tax=Kineococcus sp. SYSU DK004 TaxID=3383125 RepID=UPI003D7E633C